MDASSILGKGNKDTNHANEYDFYYDTSLMVQFCKRSWREIVNNCVRTGLDVFDAVYTDIQLLKKSCLRYCAILSKYGTKHVIN